MSAMPLRESRRTPACVERSAGVTAIARDTHLEAPTGGNVKRARYTASLRCITLRARRAQRRRLQCGKHFRNVRVDVAGIVQRRDGVIRRGLAV